MYFFLNCGILTVTYLRGMCEMQRVEDYNGVTYNSLEEMCSAHNVKVATFKARLNRGLSLQDALDGLFVRDHLGGRFSSVRAMCKHWDIFPSTYYYRVNELGMSVGDALTSPKHVDFHYIEDHLGNRFGDVFEMCSHWGISYDSYLKWLKKGFTPKDVLEGNVYNYEDHQGNKFLTLGEMCEYWGTTPMNYNYAMKTYGSVEIALLGAKYGSYSVRVGEVVHGYRLDECIVDFDFSSGKSSYLYKATCVTCGDEIKYKAGSLLRGVKKCKVCRILKDNNITIGATYGTLTVVKPIVIGRNKVHLLCRCSCGNMREVKPYKLKLATSRCHC